MEKYIFYFMVKAIGNNRVSLVIADMDYHIINIKE